MQDRKLLDTDLVFTETDEVLIVLPQHTLKRDTADHRKLLQVATCNKCQDWYGFIALISKRLISTAEKLKEAVSCDTVIDMYGIGCELRCPWNRKKISIGITARVVVKYFMCGDKVVASIDSALISAFPSGLDFLKLVPKPGEICYQGKQHGIILKSSSCLVSPKSFWKILRYYRTTQLLDSCGCRGKLGDLAMWVIGPEAEALDNSYKNVSRQQNAQILNKYSEFS